MVKQWPEEQKIGALTVADATSASNAAAQTGIPRGTIVRWQSEARRRAAATDAGIRANQRTRELQQAAMDQAVEQAGEYIADRLKGLADKLYRLADKAADKVEQAIDPVQPGGEPYDRERAAWVRSLVGVLSQAIDKMQLLTGKPTARPEVKTTCEFAITQRIVSEQPDLIDAIFAQAERPDLEDWRR